MELIFGTAQLTRRYGILAPAADRDQNEASGAALLATAYDLGIRCVDTAPVYGDAEAVIGTSNLPFRIHTKLAPGLPPERSLACSLTRLRRESVDVLYIHDPVIVLDAEDPRIAAVAQLAGEGVESIGASVYTREQFLAAVADPKITVVQVPINVLDRGITDEDCCFASQSGTEVIARSVLLQGLLGDPALAMGRVPLLDEALDAFQEVCARVGRTPIELAVGWVSSRPSVTGIVIGAENPEQLDGLVRAARSAALSPGEIKALSALPLPSQGAVDPRTWSSLY